MKAFFSRLLCFSCHFFQRQVVALLPCWTEAVALPRRSLSSSTLSLECCVTNRLNYLFGKPIEKFLLINYRLNSVERRLDITQEMFTVYWSLQFDWPRPEP